MTLRIADLCCGAGGAAVGLARALPDAEIVGYDVAPQPRYPFRFVQADALAVDLEGFDFAWASVPCQAYARTRSLPGRASSSASYPQLIAPMRAKLRAWGGPWIMENVERAPLLDAITLCGVMFGLRVYRHRLFEAPFMLLAPPHQRHTEPINPRVDGHRPAGYYCNDPERMVTVAGNLFRLDVGRAAMGVDWPMSKRELAEAVPPSYSAYLAQFIPCSRGN